MISKCDRFVRYIKKIVMSFILFPMRVFPIVSNRVVLCNCLSYKYSGNPKYVSEYLKDHYPRKLDLVYIVNDINDYDYLNKQGIRTVKAHTLKQYYYEMTCKVYLTNSGGISYVPFSKKQYVINTWHGGGAYKKDGDFESESSIFYRLETDLTARKTSIILSTNHKFTTIHIDTMRVPANKFWEIGMPRNDILIRGDEEKLKETRKNIGLNEEKLVLYAPTYRNMNGPVAILYNIDSKRVCEALKKRFGGKWKFAMRLHPTVVNRDGIIPPNAIDLTDYEDMQELLLAADVMINDFSSSMWDFMLTGKPCFTYAVDLQHYVDTTKVYTPVEEWPFPKSTNNDELVESILNFDEERYREDCKRHYEALGGCETGHACEQVCKRIAEVCGVGT